MRSRAWIGILAVATIAVLAVSATAAFAAPGGGKKPPTTTTTTTQPILMTCQARVDAGANAWILGSYDEAQGSYTVGGLPACIDLRPEHAGTRQWQVVWDGTMRKPPGRGLRLVFEPEVHDFENAYLDTVVYGLSGSQQFLIAAPEATPFVFVVMPWSGDRWTSIKIVVTPLP